jgi:hypothetical protein
MEIFMRNLPFPMFLLLVLFLFLQSDLPAQEERSDEQSARAPEMGIGSGAFGTRGNPGFAGPTVELRSLHAITPRTSLRARLGVTPVLYGRIDAERDIGRLMFHAALEGYWLLAAPAADMNLYGTFGMTGGLYSYTHKRGRFYLVNSYPDGLSPTDLETMFGPSAGIGLRLALNETVWLSGELQGMVNLVYPYDPSLGGSAMVGLGWKL